MSPELVRAAIVEKARWKKRQPVLLDAANGEDRELFVDRITGARQLQRSEKQDRRNEDSDQLHATVMRLSA